MRSLVIAVASGMVASALVGACASEGEDTTSGGSEAASGAGATGASSSSTGAQGGAASSTGATGGSGGAAGGAGGTGGATAGGAGPGGGGNVMAECDDAADCTVINDCCNCIAIPNTEQPPACNIPECFVPTCTAQGDPSPVVECVTGHCVTGFDCDWSVVVCNSPPPACPPGQTASVSGGCWGACVPSAECHSVGSCAQCSTGQTCIEEQQQVGPGYHCVDTPAACTNMATCACMGAATCIAPYDTCNDGPNGIVCSCPTC